MKRISCRIEWFLFQLHSLKHARVIIIILLVIRKATILAFWSQGVKLDAVWLLCSTLPDYTNKMLYWKTGDYNGSLLNKTKFTNIGHHNWLYGCILHCQINKLGI